MGKQTLANNSDFLLSAGIALFFATLSALAFYAVVALEQSDLFI